MDDTDVRTPALGIMLEEVFRIRREVADIHTNVECLRIKKNLDKAVESTRSVQQQTERKDKFLKIARNGLMLMGSIFCVILFAAIFQTLLEK